MKRFKVIYDQVVAVVFSTDFVSTKELDEFICQNTLGDFKEVPSPLFAGSPRPIKSNDFSMRMAEYGLEIILNGPSIVDKNFEPTKYIYTVKTSATVEVGDYKDSADVQNMTKRYLDNDYKVIDYGDKLVRQQERSMKFKTVKARSGGKNWILDESLEIYPEAYQFSKGEYYLQLYKEFYQKVDREVYVVNKSFRIL